MASEITRRTPSQARSEARIDRILDAASAIIARDGYEAATLTAVAAYAKTSIGSLYQYFPDKPAIAVELARRHGVEIADRWEACMADVTAETLSTDFIARMVTMATDFMHERPAYLPLATDMPGYRHDEADRHRLRVCIEAAVLMRWPVYGDTRATLIAETTVGIIRALGVSLRRGPEARRSSLIAEYKGVLTAYYGTL